MTGPAPEPVDLGPGVRAAFTTREHGNLSAHVADDAAAVAERGSAVARALDVDAARVTWCRQVHGARVAVVRDGHPVEFADTDALVTELSSTPLAVLAADCAPIALADAEAGVVAAVHAGRRGLRDGVVGAAIDAMRSVGAGRITAVVGPCIERCCYQVGPDVYEDLVAVYPAAATRTRDGALGLDLRAGVGAALASAGVDAVRHVGGCTVDQPTRWFSHRRDGVTGRHAAYVWRA